MNAVNLIVILFLLNVVWIIITLYCINKIAKLVQRLNHIKEVSDQALSGEVFKNTALTFIVCEADLNLKCKN